jgi:hypothetical protein
MWSGVLNLSMRGRRFIRDQSCKLRCKSEIGLRHWAYIFITRRWTVVYMYCEETHTILHCQLKKKKKKKPP